MTASQATPAERIVPMKMAHLVFRCADRKAMVDWYRKLFQAELVFEDDILTFFNMPHLPPKSDEVTGVHHIAYSYASIADLLNTYLRLKEEGIRPYWCINHGPTTSLYFRDPEGNDIELQVDNFVEAADAAAFFHSETFANDPIGLEFDPDAMVELWRSGASDAELCQLGTAATGTRTVLG